MWTSGCCFGWEGVASSCTSRGTELEVAVLDGRGARTGSGAMSLSGYWYVRSRRTGVFGGSVVRVMVP